ncbi:MULTISPECIES: acyl-CoA dehydrogenase family protein [unclassified Variovorax]|uniref:acyl-CoA dehydrogenase family protein n=1 Tax=unclassified Variovorax TaxID=663243 RepID=UPI000A4AFF82|nr:MULTISPECIES: acyl-CoA dehydrogenase family protein [unclassified Variovorax]PNG46058.1 Caffeyl-CoA reductase-Etf complex subunit CarC [Variovorax sp. B2]PNG46284.1 Caffeyl-CoA reductase-Etf complex subunit CarC [Variovorax sp. B4]VTV19162.1 Glutaryl-CoA dehydrogenase [Variovorax sp. WDL1]
MAEVPETNDFSVRLAMVTFSECGRRSLMLPVLGSLLLGLFRKLGKEWEQLTQVQGLRVATSVDTAVESLKVEREALSGELGFVECLQGANHLLVLAEHRAIVVEVQRSNVKWTVQTGLVSDELVHARMQCASIRAIAGDSATLERAFTIARLLLSARACGAVQRSFELACEHAALRTQFGRPIAAFQAVQHMLADAALLLEGLTRCIDGAAAAMDAQRSSATYQAAAATSAAGLHLPKIAIKMHQVMGAIGFAEEHAMPRLTRQAISDVHRIGGPRASRAAIMVQLARRIEQ